MIIEIVKTYARRFGIDAYSTCVGDWIVDFHPLNSSMSVGDDGVWISVYVESECVFYDKVTTEDGVRIAFQHLLGLDVK